MAKKERKFYNELDFLRHQVRELAVETGTVIKDTNFMKKEECKEEIEVLNRVKYRKEVEAETRANIENLKRELADRNNQITTLEKKKVILENEKKNCIDIILEKDEKIEELKIEIKELQESNKFMEETIEAGNKIIAANIEKLEELEKEIKEKNAEIRESQLTLEKKEKELERCKNHNIKLIEKIDSLTIEITELKNRKWYHSLFNFFKI
ncbi:hypothetical protein [Fusobacterium sp.]|uniref:hypothetical protein n=1 Tax=Fusobacterium sp. TaxID=68766 RepID=UPI000E9803BB|nr:hypothetical protein [Fusobacterium sp.]HBJ80164.1 hypothetical protein [Fusobacterium sp.]